MIKPIFGYKMNNSHYLNIDDQRDLLISEVLIKYWKNQMNNLPIVYNLEPLNYSKKAKKNWLNYNFKYEEGSPEELFKFKNLKHVKILIIKLKNYR